MPSEISSRCPWHFDAFNGGIRVNDESAALQKIIDVISCLAYVARNVHSETWCLRDREAIVKCDCAWNATETYE